MEERAGTDIDAPVAIVGAGPVGLALALGLARHGVRSVLLERQQTTSSTSKAPAIHVRTREVLRQWGVEQRFLDEGTLHRVLHMHNAGSSASPLLSVDFTELDHRADNPGLLVLPQDETERLLLDAVRDTGMCDIHFGTAVTDVKQGADGVLVVSNDLVVRAAYAVGCDGASSVVRKALRLPFDGMTYSLRPLLADVLISDERDALPYPRVSTRDDGLAFVVRLQPGLWRLVHLRREEPRHEEVQPAEITEPLQQLLGDGPADIKWSSRFRIHVRSSPRFRVGRVLLAGDAAHVHSPASGQGMNGGIHDAHNLAWKLAAALNGGDAERLLESYDIERRATVVESTSRYTDFITRVFIQAPGVVRNSAWLMLRAMMRSGRARRRMLHRVAMLDLHYPRSPILRGGRARGELLPNPMLRAPDGRAVRLHDLIPSAPVILDVAEEREFASGLPAEHVIAVGARAYQEPTGTLRRMLGRQDGWIVVRPDLCIAGAWRSRDRLERGWREALALVDR